MKDHLKVWLFCLVLGALIFGIFIYHREVDAQTLPPIDEGEEIVIIDEDCKVYGTL